MYFVLFDPIFWINKTLATFDRMVAKLQKYTDKINAELEATKGASLAILDKVEEKTQKMADKTNEEVRNIRDNALIQKEKVIQQADIQVKAISAREFALSEAKRKATNAARNISKLMED